MVPNEGFIRLEGGVLFWGRECLTPKRDFPRKAIPLKPGGLLQPYLFSSPSLSRVVHWGCPHARSSGIDACPFARPMVWRPSARRRCKSTPSSATRRRADRELASHERGQTFCSPWAPFFFFSHRTGFVSYDLLSTCFLVSGTRRKELPPYVHSKSVPAR